MFYVNKAFNFLVSKKVEVNILGWSWYPGGHYGLVKNGRGCSGHRAQKLDLTEQEIDGITDFLQAATNLGKLKVTSINFGWDWSEIGVAT